MQKVAYILPAKWGWMKINGLQIFCRRFSGDGFALFILAATKKWDSGTYRRVPHGRRKHLLSKKKKLHIHVKEADYLHTYCNYKVIMFFDANLYLLYDIDCGFVLSLIPLDKPLLTIKNNPRYLYIVDT